MSGASPERAPEPEAEPETEFGTPTATADVGAELAEVRANQAATATALETLLTQVASLTSAVAAAGPSGAPGAPRLPSSPPPSAPAPAPEPGSLSGHAGAAVLRALLIRCCWGIAALGRRQVGVAVGLRNFTCSASLQPGTGSGVGGKGRWAAIAAPPQADSAGGRGKIATVVSGGGPARVRASLYVHERTS